MKRLLFLLFVAMATISVNAQTYYGYLTRNVDYYKKGEGIMYRKTRSGKIQLPEGAEYMGAYPPSIVKWSGYYIGGITDPVDNYVNVRKGPGTKYAVVRRVHTYEWLIEHDNFVSETDGGWFFYQKTSGNWWKLYDKPGKFIGYIYYDRIDEYVGPEWY